MWLRGPKERDFRNDDCQLPEEMVWAVGDIRIGWGPSTGQILNRAGDEDLFFLQTDLRISDRNNLPDLPMNGRPILASSLPGASPIKAISA